jgi:hypothetical protein
MNLDPRESCGMSSPICLGSLATQQSIHYMIQRPRWPERHLVVKLLLQYSSLEGKPANLGYSEIMEVKPAKQLIYTL